MVGHNEMIKVACDEVFTLVIDTILEYYSTLEDRLEVLDHTFDIELESVLKNIENEVNIARKGILRSIKWNLARIHMDERLVDDLIEEQIADGETTLDNFLKDME